MAKFGLLNFFGLGNPALRFLKCPKLGTYAVDDWQNTILLTAPPIKPSQVFFGLSLMSGVLPKKKPNMYAITSFITTIRMGRMNQISASNMFWK
jgi:hypothetical protein